MKPNSHTRIRRGYSISPTVARRQALTHFSGIASGTDPDNITFADLDFEKVIISFSGNRDLYEKGTEKSCISVPLNFNLVEKEQLPRNREAAQNLFQ